MALFAHIAELRGGGYAVVDWPEDLFVAEGDHRVDARCLTRGDQAGS